MTLLPKIFLRIALAGLLVLAASSCLAQSVLLVDAQLVDPRARSVRPGNLLIVDGVIAGSPETPPDGFDGTVIDLEGRWVIPGLHDLHTHSVLNMGTGGVFEMLGSEIMARRMLYAGVTGFLDLFNDQDYVLGLRDRLRESPAPNQADLYAAGPCLTATGGHGTEYPIPARIVDTPEDAVWHVDELARHRPDVVKIIYDHMTEEERATTWRKVMPSIDKATLLAAVGAARRHGIPTVIHVHSWRDVRDAVEAGADAITHLPYAVSDPMPEDLPKKMAEAGTLVIPALAVGDPTFTEVPPALGSPLLAAVTTAAVLDAYRKLAPTEVGQRAHEGLQRTLERRGAALHALVEAGVPVALGTDAGNTFAIHGHAVHREMALMVEVGLGPWEALHAAGPGAGDFLGRSVGLSKGDLGSVVVLDASPIEDIRHTEEIHLVIHRGRVIDRETLRAKPDEAWIPPRPSNLSRPSGSPSPEG